MGAKIFITSSGYDPEKGKHVKDPYLGENPTMGACHPDIRSALKPGEYLFVVSGKVPGIDQYIIGGFQVAEKISAVDAYLRYPMQRLRLRTDGQLTGNIIVDASGHQHYLDNHSKFNKRVDNYVVGYNPIRFDTEVEIARARWGTMNILRRLFKKNGDKPFDIIGRGYRNLNDQQLTELLNWADRCKRPDVQRKSNRLRKGRRKAKQEATVTHEKHSTRVQNQTNQKAT